MDSSRAMGKIHDSESVLDFILMEYISKHNVFSQITGNLLPSVLADTDATKVDLHVRDFTDVSKM